jgi:hypothetical protein
MNIDYAPTIVAAAGAKAGRVMDGLSLLPLARDPSRQPGRDLLIDNAPGNGHFDAIRTRRYLYAEYANGDRELYDLRRDPYELQSEHANPAYAALRDALSARMHALVSCAGPSCRARPAARFALRCTGRKMHLAVAATDATSVAFYAERRRIARDSRRPLRVVVRRRSGTVRARVDFRFDRVATFDRRGCR